MAKNVGFVYSLSDRLCNGDASIAAVDNSIALDFHHRIGWNHLRLNYERFYSKDENASWPSSGCCSAVGHGWDVKGYRSGLELIVAQHYLALMSHYSRLLDSDNWLAGRPCCLSLLCGFLAAGFCSKGGSAPTGRHSCCHGLELQAMSTFNAPSRPQIIQCHPLVLCNWHQHTWMHICVDTHNTQRFTPPSSCVHKCRNVT